MNAAVDVLTYFLPIKLIDMIDSVMGIQQQLCDIISVKWIDFDGSTHRMDTQNAVTKPAMIIFYKNGSINVEMYLRHGIFHRINGPCRICYHKNGTPGALYYVIDNKLTRDNGPAHIEYYETGQLGFVGYYKDDVYHREHGPAQVMYHPNGSLKYQKYFLHGREL